MDVGAYVCIAYMYVSVLYYMKFCCGNKNYLKKYDASLCRMHI